MSTLSVIVVTGIVGGICGLALGALGQLGAPPSRKDGPVDRPEELARARALREASDRRLGAVLIVLGILIWPAGIMVIAVAQANGYDISIYLPIAVTSAALLMRGRRMRVKDAEGVLEDDPRPPIVYLRPFEIDRTNRRAIAPDALRGRTAEEKMAHALRHVAPFVALGDPTEDLPELGAGRLYADDDRWQGTVEDLTKRAGTIILYAGGGSDGLAWEVQHVVGLGQPERVVLVQGRSKDYDVFCKTFAHLFPRGLLDNAAATSPYLYFDADWTPRSFDRHPNIEAFRGSPGEQREQVLRRLLKVQL
jgi:hypothetical protein